MSCLLRGTSVGLVLLLSVGTAHAQIIQRPERPLRGVFGSDPPIDPNRTRQDLILNVSTLGGYDDNPSPQDTGGGADAFTPREPGYNGFAEAALTYRRTHQTELFSVNGRGYGNAYRNLGLTPTYGGDVEARLSTPLGRSNQLDFSAAGHTAPYYAIAAFVPIQASVSAEGTADAGMSAAYGFSARRSIAADGSVSLTSRWSNKNTLTETYRYSVQRFRDHAGDGEIHNGALDYSRTIGRHSRLSASFHHTNQTIGEITNAVDMSRTTRPMQQDAVEVGYQEEHRLRQGRRWSFALGGGATHVQTTRYASEGRFDYTTPSGYGGVRFDVARTWSIWSDYRRGVTVLEGLTAQSFVTDSSSIRIGGYIGPRAEVAISGGYSNGTAPVAANSQSTFDSYAATFQLRFLLTRWWSAVVSENLYRYQLHRFESLPQGLRSELDRNAIRVGMTFGLPLYGSYATDRRPPSRGRN